MQDQTHKQRQALERAVYLVGGAAELAQRLGVSRQAVHKWLHGRVPAERVLEIERHTLGTVSRYDLRPDLYPKEPPTPRERRLRMRSETV